MAKNVKLSTRSNDVLIDWAQLAQLDRGNCWLLLLDDWEIGLIFTLLRYAEWERRWVNQPADFSLVRVKLAEMEYCLMSGCTLSDLSTAIVEAAQIIANSAGRAGGSNSGANCFPSSAILNCLGSYTDAELLDTPAAPASVHGDVPPTGFATMAAYRTYKCQVALALINELITFFRGLQAYSAVVSTFNNVIAWLGGLLAQIATFTVGPSQQAAMAEKMFRMLNLAPTAFSLCGDMADYLNDNKDEIRCALYRSGSAAQATIALTGWLDDMVQSVSWTAAFGESVGPALGGLMGELAAQFEGNGLTNSLFTLVLDVGLPEADCSDCGTDLSEWGFDTDEQGWEFEDESIAPSTADGEWTAAEPHDPSDPSEGHLTTAMSGIDARGRWRYFFDNPPVASADTVFTIDAYLSSDQAAAAILAYIVFDDETTIATEYRAAGWRQMEIPLAAHEETWGKSIDRLELYIHRFSGDATPFTADFDHGDLALS